MLANNPVKAKRLEEGNDTSKVKTLKGKQLNEVTVSAHRVGRVKTKGIGNTEMINATELLRAACCNLGESFTTNPSVDVNYADAATGAQQIKLLGLSGTYDPRISLLRRRGVLSVKRTHLYNVHESITGQINVEFKKPQATPFADANLYYNSKGKLEANIGANLHLSKRWRTALLGHYEILNKAHDDNDDGFVDLPKVRQGALQSRWAWMGDHYVFQTSVKGLKEHRDGGQIGHHAMAGHPYLIDITNERYEAFTKNAYIFDKERATNVALILSGSLHHENAEYGHKLYNTDQRNGYASLMFESDFGEHHNLSVGASLNHDYYDQRYKLTNDGAEKNQRDDETVPGIYAQYTFKLGT